MKKKFDLVFSLGYDCNASLALRKAGLQFRSYPFDWLTNAPLSSRAALLAGGFDGFLADPSQLEDLGAATFDRFGEKHRVVRDRATALEFRHDFPLAADVASGLDLIRGKYRRRSERLISEIDKAESVLAVWCAGFRHPELTAEELESARAVLAGRFGGKIRVLGVAHADVAASASLEFSESGVALARIPCGAVTAQGFEVSIRQVAGFLAANIETADPRTPGEKCAHRALERARTLAKYGAKGPLDLIWKRMAFRIKRARVKRLQKRGLLPPNEPV